MSKPEVLVEPPVAVDPPTVDEPLAALVPLVVAEAPPALPRRPVLEVPPVLGAFVVLLRPPVAVALLAPTLEVPPASDAPPLSLVELCLVPPAESVPPDAVADLPPAATAVSFESVAPPVEARLVEFELVAVDAPPRESSAVEAPPTAVLADGVLSSDAQAKNDKPTIPVSVIAENR